MKPRLCIIAAQVLSNSNAGFEPQLNHHTSYCRHFRKLMMRLI